MGMSAEVLRGTVPNGYGNGYGYGYGDGDGYPEQELQGARSKLSTLAATEDHRCQMWSISDLAGLAGV